jgi:hypothetical protein
VNTGIHSWIQGIVDASARGLQDNPFAGLMQTVGSALGNSFQLRPAVGLCVLTGCLAAAAVVSHTRLLSVFGSQFLLDQGEKQRGDPSSSRQLDKGPATRAFFWPKPGHSIGRILNDHRP